MCGLQMCGCADCAKAELLFNLLRLMKKKYRIILVLIILIAIVYVAGPAPDEPIFANNPGCLPAFNFEGQDLADFVQDNEPLENVKPDNEARIVWADDSSKQKTEYSIVYLHGFSASQEEGDPIHTNIAKKFGCNLYLSRLAEHGLNTTEQFINLTADSYWNSAKAALAIGKQLGQKVILMATSTGGTLALMLAAHFPSDVHSLVLLSPNIAIKDGAAVVLNNHWGLQIARLVKGSDYVDSKDQRDIYKKYWYSHYRLEGAVALQEMIETSMTEKTFKKIRQPTLMLYYYKDEVHQDSVVSVSAMKKMFEQLGSHNKKSVAMPLTGDHVIGSWIKSKDVAGVEKEIELFLQKLINP